MNKNEKKMHEQLRNLTAYRRPIAVLAAWILNLEAHRCDSVQDYADLIYSFRLGFGNFSISIRPMQVKSELVQLANLVKDLKPSAVLEIGTARGGTLLFWCRLASEEAAILSIDLPGGPFGGGYPEWRMLFYRKMARPKQKITLLRENSHEQQTLRKIKDTLNGRQLDFLFIDGDHSFEGVKKDFEVYSPLVRSGGIIAFHDIVPGPEEKTGRVPRYWQELKKDYRFSELVENLNQKGYGIGIIYKQK